MGSHGSERLGSVIPTATWRGGTDRRLLVGADQAAETGRLGDRGDPPDVRGAGGDAGDVEGGARTQPDRFPRILQGADVETYGKVPAPGELGVDPHRAARVLEVNGIVVAQDLGVAERRVPGVEAQRHVDRLQADAVSETAFHFGEEAVVDPAVTGDVVAEQVVAEVDDPLQKSADCSQSSATCNPKIG